MKNLHGIIHFAGWLIISLLLLHSTDSIAQLKKMSEKDLTKESTAVLYGKCTKKSCAWDENHRIIFTYITIATEEYIKGNMGAEAVIAVPGGQVGDIIYEVSEMPVFTEGEDVVAFVWKNPKGKNLVTGGSQGVLKIEKDKKTGKRMVKTKDQDTAGDGEILESFITKLKGYMKH